MSDQPKVDLKITGVHLPGDRYADPTPHYQVGLTLSRRMTHHEEEVFVESASNIMVHGNSVTIGYTTIEQVKADKDLWSQRLAHAVKEGARLKAEEDALAEKQRAAREAERERRQKVADEIEFD